MIRRLTSLQPWTLLRRRVLHKYIIFCLLECTTMETGTLAYDHRGYREQKPIRIKDEQIVLYPMIDYVCTISSIVNAFYTSPNAR